MTVATRRLESLGLAPSSADGVRLNSAVDVARHLLAMQGQDWGASQWAIGSRLVHAGVTRDDVLAAYDRGEIVRSWPMRGTVHVVAREDLHWLLELLGERALRGVERRWEMLGIDGTVLEHGRQVALDLLGGGRAVTRKEFQAALGDAGHDFSGPRGYHVVWFLAQTGTLVQGPTRDGEQLLVLLDEWIPKRARTTFASREDALAELGRRYLRAHAPARVADLQWWSSLGVRDCRAAFDAASDEFEPAGDGDDALWQRREHANATAKPSSSMLALAGFDEHLLGYKRRDEVLDLEHATLVDPARNGVFRWTLVDRGRVIATWKRTKRAKHVLVDIQPFAPLSDAKLRAATKAIERWGAFVGNDVQIRVESASR